MKKILFLLLLGFFGVFLISCQEDCEKHNYGSVTVINGTHVPIVVDVTWGGSVYNSERYLSPGSSTRYEKVPAGSVRIWGNAGYGWSSVSRTLRSCQSMSFTWHAGKSESFDMGEEIVNNHNYQEFTKMD